MGVACVRFAIEFFIFMKFPFVSSSFFLFFYFCLTFDKCEYYVDAQYAKKEEEAEESGGEGRGAHLNSEY